MSHKVRLVEVKVPQAPDGMPALARRLAIVECHGAPVADVLWRHHTDALNEGRCNACGCTVGPFPLSHKTPGLYAL